MNAGKTLFAQLMDFLPWSTFNRYVARYSGDKGIRTLSCAEQFRVTRVRQLLTQVHEFIRGCFKKCHYSKVSCSGSRGFVRFKAAKMLACSVLVVDSPVLG